MASSSSGSAFVATPGHPHSCRVLMSSTLLRHPWPQDVIHTLGADSPARVCAKGVNKAAGGGPLCPLEWEVPGAWAFPGRCKLGARKLTRVVPRSALRRCFVLIGRRGGGGAGCLGPPMALDGASL